ncbi:unnamed protein product [Oreochromis niloticus]|nr:unnamed protein product [Mustela putorius furo]
MAAGTALLCSTLLFVLVFVSADQEIITAESGQDVTLTCRAPKINIITRLQWSREDLKPEFVFVYRNGKFVPANQHPSFKNRVDLQDRQMKDGDVSLILKDVTTDDGGKYKCHVFMKARSDQPTLEFFNIIYLSVDPPDEIITAESGQDVTLTCRAPDNNITGVEWSRADLEDEYVLLSQDEQFYPDNQHPSFKNRVDLQDRQMKDGDVSLILKDVTINDTGTYVCRVFMAEIHPWQLSIIDLHVIDPPVEKNITAESGQDVTLTCRAPNNNIRVVKWRRAELGDEYVLWYWEGYLDPSNQHPFFKNRVDLQDRQMKDGNMSLILKNVKINDTGTYECRVLTAGTDSWRSISIIYLTVVDPPGE